MIGFHKTISSSHETHKYCDIMCKQAKHTPSLTQRKIRFKGVSMEIKDRVLPWGFENSTLGFNHESTIIIYFSSQ